MKKTILLSLALIWSMAMLAQDVVSDSIRRDLNGNISFIKFPRAANTRASVKASDFFEQILHIPTGNQFVKVKSQSRPNGMVHETYEQNYQGVQIEGAVYILHHKEGILTSANGHYVPVENLNVIPKINEEEAWKGFASYKGIAIQTVNGYNAELLIKEIPQQTGATEMTIPRLVYRIYLHSDSEKNTEYGYVDAHTGKTVFTSPISTDLTNDGIFETRYNGIQHGITQETPKGYRLLDITRGSGIEVRNLEGKNIFGESQDLVDNDNNWTRQEHGANNNDMALDVYWTLQQIYDRLKITHGINSYDDKGFPIIAYIRCIIGNDVDNAAWMMNKYLAFGVGQKLFYPLASADVIGHEFGHGITHFNIGWDKNYKIFNEGLSDIWGAIFKHAVNPNSQYWQIGNQITRAHSCLRNMQYPADSKAKTQIADTYGSELYWKTNNYYVRGGVFSHWFYLLVNGKTGTNSIGNQYLVKGIGMEKAENLSLIPYMADI